MDSSIKGLHFLVEKEVVDKKVQDFHRTVQVKIAAN